MKNIILIISLIIILGIENLFSQTPVPYLQSVLVDSERRPFRKPGIPLITDLDKDGQKEIIFFSLDYYGVSSPVGFLHVIKSDGSNFTGFPLGFNDYPLDIASGDVNGDGVLDIALRFSFSVNVIDLNGQSLPGFPLVYSDGNLNPIKFISIYDLDNDKKLELIISKKGEVRVVNFNGLTRNGWPVYIPGEAVYNPAVGDLDNDGFAEIITTSFRHNNPYIDSGYINVFKQNGEIFSGNWPVKLDSNYYSWSSSPSLYLNPNDINTNYILAVADRSIDNMTYSNHMFMKFNIYGNLIEKKYHESHFDFGTLVIGDLNKDGFLESASGTQYGITLSGFDSDLKRISGWPKDGVGEHEATACIGKLTFNNQLNVINNSWFANNDGGYIYAYTPDGISLPWTPLRPTGIAKAISLADINNDGSVEIICTSTKTGQQTFLDIWTIPGIPYTNEDFPWPQYGHDRYRTNQFGFIPPDEPVGIQPYSTTVPEKFSLSQNYPNPFNPSTVINYEIQVTDFAKLIVYDVLGNEVATLVNEKQNAGSYSAEFDGSSFSSGIYFYKLDAGEFSETKRMILLK